MWAVLGDGGGDGGDVALEVLVVVEQAFRLSGLADGVDQLRDALAARCYRGQYRGAQFIGQFGDIDGNAARRGFVVHVQGEHHGHAEFGQQGAQGQRAAQVLGVADLYQAAYRFAEQGAHGGAFIIAARGQGEDARGVEQFGAGIEAGRGAGDFDRRAGVVRDIDVGAGQAVEENRFADIGVADEEDGWVGVHDGQVRVQRWMAAFSQSAVTSPVCRAQGWRWASSTTV